MKKLLMVGLVAGMLVVPSANAVMSANCTQLAQATQASTNRLTSLIATLKMKESIARDADLQSFLNLGSQMLEQSIAEYQLARQKMTLTGNCDALVNQVQMSMARIAGFVQEMSNNQKIKGNPEVNSLLAQVIDLLTQAGNDYTALLRAIQGDAAQVATSASTISAAKNTLAQ